MCHARAFLGQYGRRTGGKISAYGLHSLSFRPCEVLMIFAAISSGFTMRKRRYWFVMHAFRSRCHVSGSDADDGRAVNLFTILCPLGTWLLVRFDSFRLEWH